MFYEIKIMIIEERLRDISGEIAENKQKHQKRCFTLRENEK